MLQYLSGIKLPAFKMKAPAPAKASPARPVALVKSLVKNIQKAPSPKAAAPARQVLKAAIKLPSVKKAVATQNAMQTIKAKSPLNAFRIQKAQVQKAIQNQQKQVEAAPVMERYRNPAPPVPTSVPEIVDELIEETETEDFNDFVDSEYPEDLQDQFDETGDYEDQGELGALFKKIAAKRQEKKAQKAEAKQNKPRAVKQKSKAEARVLKAQRPKGEVLKKLIDTGAKIIDTKINKGQTDFSEQMPEPPIDPRDKGGFLSTIPMPVKIGGGIGLGLLALYLGKKMTSNN